MNKLKMQKKRAKWSTRKKKQVQEQNRLHKRAMKQAQHSNTQIKSDQRRQQRAKLKINMPITPIEKGKVVESIVDSCIKDVDSQTHLTAVLEKKVFSVTDSRKDKCLKLVREIRGHATANREVDHNIAVSHLRQLCGTFKVMSELTGINKKSLHELCMPLIHCKSVTAVTAE